MQNTLSKKSFKVDKKILNKEQSNSKQTSKVNKQKTDISSNNSNIKVADLIGTYLYVIINIDESLINKKITNEADFLANNAILKSSSLKENVAVAKGKSKVKESIQLSSDKINELPIAQPNSRQTRNIKKKALNYDTDSMDSLYELIFEGDLLSKSLPASKKHKTNSGKGINTQTKSTY